MKRVLTDPQASPAQLLRAAGILAKVARKRSKKFLNNLPNLKGLARKMNESDSKESLQ